MTSTLILGLLLAAAAPQQQPDKKEAKWLTSYKDAVALAAKEGKPLVVDGSREG